MKLLKSQKKILLCICKWLLSDYLLNKILVINLLFGLNIGV